MPAIGKRRKSRLRPPVVRAATTVVAAAVAVPVELVTAVAKVAASADSEADAAVGRVARHAVHPAAPATRVVDAVAVKSPHRAPSPSEFGYRTS